jgi:hypothetical protein
MYRRGFCNHCGRSFERLKNPDRLIALKNPANWLVNNHGGGKR